MSDKVNFLLEVYVSALRFLVEPGAMLDLKRNGLNGVDYNFTYQLTPLKFDTIAFLKNTEML